MKRNEHENLVIQITNDSYGSKSDGLGENLMKAYIFTLTETSPRPKTILFINRGALLTTDGSPVLDSLKALEADGVEILTCGTCIDFFNLSPPPAAGTITNMQTIAKKLNNADNTIVI